MTCQSEQTPSLFIHIDSTLLRPHRDLKHPQAPFTCTSRCELMERSVPSVADSPISPPSPSFSDSSADDSASTASERAPKQETVDPNQVAPHAPITPSRPASRSSVSSGVAAQQEFTDAAYGDTANCMWDDCGIVFTHLPTLIEHIHSGK